MESVGFKEWAIVCEALGRGEQSILLRKGGIAEGREGFGFCHSEFFLFPTFFHEQAELVRKESLEIPKDRKGEIKIRYFAKLIAAKHITSWETAAGLEPLHVLREPVVRQRFDYEESGLHVALVRVFRLAPSWIIRDVPAYGGCRSWVTLPDPPPETEYEPVLPDQATRELVRKFGAIA